MYKDKINILQILLTMCNIIRQKQFFPFNLRNNFNRAHKLEDLSIILCFVTLLTYINILLKISQNLLI